MFPGGRTTRFSFPSMAERERFGDRIATNFRRVEYASGRRSNKSTPRVGLRFSPQERRSSRPAARGMLVVYPWSCVAVDLEDPWLSLGWGGAVDEPIVRTFLQRADLVTANGRLIATEYSSLSGRIVHALPNGIDDSFLEKVKSSDSKFELPGRPSTCKALYTGNINARIDLEMIRQVVEQCQHVDFVFIGPLNLDKANGLQWQSLVARSNFFHIPPIEHAEIPGALKAADVLLLPYQREGGTLMFPAKLFEYLATGKPIVVTIDFTAGATEIPSQRICGSVPEVVSAIKMVADGSWAIAPRMQAQCFEIASRQNWSFRAKKFLDLVQSTRPTRFGEQMGTHGS
jgi:glycosyltransferase involved in cell wall biosynthesis